MLLAGADTTGTAFQAFMRFVMSEPGVYDKLMAEIDAATRAGAISGAMPQYEEVQTHLPYYVACVKEAMRLNPSAPNIFPRLAPKGGLTLFGKYIPEGMEVTCNPWIVHRDRNVFGDDADEFRPERWLEEGGVPPPEALPHGINGLVTFLDGPRNCLGWRLGELNDALHIHRDEN